MYIAIAALLQREWRPISDVMNPRISGPSIVAASLSFARRQLFDKCWMLLSGRRTVFIVDWIEDLGIVRILVMMLAHILIGQRVGWLVP